MQHVVVRLAERHGSGGLASEPAMVALPSASFCTSGLGLSNVTVPGPRYFQHLSVTAGTRLAHGRARTARVLHVVGGPQIELKRR